MYFFQTILGIIKEVSLSHFWISPLSPFFLLSVFLFSLFILSFFCFPFLIPPCPSLDSIVLPTYWLLQEEYQAAKQPQFCWDRLIYFIFLLISWCLFCFCDQNFVDNTCMFSAVAEQCFHNMFHTLASKQAGSGQEAGRGCSWEN